MTERRRSREPRRVGEVLARLSEDLGLGGAHRAAGVIRAWEAEMGPEIAARAQPVRVDGGVLLVRVDDPGWATELRYRSAEIVRRLNDSVGEELVTDVKVVVGRPGAGGKG